VLRESNQSSSPKRTFPSFPFQFRNLYAPPHPYPFHPHPTPTQITTMVSVVWEDATAIAPASHRRLIFAHHAEQQRASALAAAQARVAALAAGDGFGDGVGPLEALGAAAGGLLGGGSSAGAQV